jgi:hypothetical protein
MDNKTRPSKVCIAININNTGNEEDYTTKEEVENNPPWGKKFVVVEFLHIVEIDQHPTSKILPIYKPKMTNITM